MQLHALCLDATAMSFSGFGGAWKPFFSILAWVVGHKPSAFNQSQQAQGPRDPL